ncbi:PDR/VanB family oxidoreductase [Falsiroseomonas sp.]|uniref:PDR/VanB family oxidoreductase n=1 Tax=Falsiroseomonas sp. TaxID=2870721 RepID=UPI002735BF39|nr:PDR/VanB family oxidoreductase [Falsiroseomonas sp.]MDP3416701.1 PDR/VanB family oxidoreductase [Falsiroseomonas sp.]
MKLLMAVEVVARRQVTAAVVQITLRPAKRAAFPPFRGGAHTILVLPDGRRRLYSLTSNPEQPELWQIAVLREPAGQGGSAWLHDEAAIGTRLLASHPQQGFGLAAEARRHILVAGGIGITPFLSMLPELRRSGADYVLHFCARSAAEAPFLPELQAECGDRLRPWISERLDLPRLLADSAPGTHAYCCGPARMLQGFAEASAHWPEGTTHVEHFAGIPRAEAQQGEAFEVEIASSGAILPIPVDRSLLEVLRAAGHGVDAACEYGACGSCVVAVESGQPLHRDVCLSPAARERSMTACVSRGKGRLRLAL